MIEPSISFACLHPFVLSLAILFVSLSPRHHANRERVLIDRATPSHPKLLIFFIFFHAPVTNITHSTKEVNNTKKTQAVITFAATISMRRSQHHSLKRHIRYLNNTIGKLIGAAGDAPTG
jgi:hypothetical protein